MCGDNGTGKSTLLRVLAGKHIHRNDAALVLGSNAYYDNTLNGRRAYLASDWGRRSVAFTGHGVAFSVRLRLAVFRVLSLHYRFVYFMAFFARLIFPCSSSHLL